MPQARLSRLVTVLLLTFVLTGAAQAQILTTRPPPLSDWDFSTIQPIAAEIQAAADRARLAASQQTRPTRREQSVALTDLTTLASAAQHFSTQIDQFRNGPDPTRVDYFDLVRLHNQAKGNVLNAGYDAAVVREFSRIRALLDRLALVYTQRWDRDRARLAADALDASLASAFNIARQRAQDNPADRRAVFLLHRLAESVGFFHQQLDREQDPLVTGADFQTLASDYGLAVRSLQPSSFEQYLEGDLTRAGQALVQLRQAYQVQWNGPNARSVAEQIRTAAGQLLERVAERVQRDGGTEPRLLDHLRLLAEISDLLARQLELRPEAPFRTYPGFLTLSAVYNESSFDLARTWFGPHMAAELNNIGQQITQLRRMYSGALDSGPAQLTGNVIGR